MADVVHQCPMLAFTLVDEVRMAEKFADGIALASAMREAIEIAAAVSRANPKEEDPPKFHTRAILLTVSAETETGSIGFSDLVRHSPFETSERMPWRIFETSTLD